MTDQELEALRFPIGRCTPKADFGDDDVRRAIDEIAAAPKELRAAVEGLSDEQLDTRYRPDGWTLRQVVHHLPDSHANAYVRSRMAVTEDAPKVKPYDEKKWAELEDARSGPIEPSLTLLEAIHNRWAPFFRALAAEDFERKLTYPEIGPMRLGEMVQLYAWHGKHHAAHITSLRDRKGWT